jgi:hypothetical protein
MLTLYFASVHGDQIDWNLEQWPKRTTMFRAICSRRRRA